MDTDCDLPLLQAIAQRRDQAAFETLHQRHQRATYSLAIAITGRWDLAEDALQAGMLAAWRAAGTFQPRVGSTVRSWLLRIVAREGLKVLRKLRQERTAGSSEEGFLKMAAAVEGPVEMLESQDALASMRSALLNLSAPDRQLVALAYGAEMSHQEIARELAVPRRTISRRLEGVLACLLADMKKAGCAAALPLAHPQAMGNALLSCFEPPLGLGERVLGEVARVGDVAQGNLSGRALGNSRRLVAAKGAIGAYVALAVLAAGVAAGMLVVHLNAKPEKATDASAVPGAALAPAQQVESVQAPQKIRANWTFEKGPADELKVTTGDWHWVPARAGLPAGMLVGGATTRVVLPLTIPEGKYLEVTIKGNPSGSSKHQAYWNTNGHPQGVIQWLMPITPVVKIKTTITCKNYLLGKWEVATFWEVPEIFSSAQVCEYENPIVRNPTVLLSLRNFILQEVQVREIAWDEVPERIRDPKKLIEELKLKTIRRTKASAPSDIKPNTENGMNSDGPLLCLISPSRIQPALIHATLRKDQVAGAAKGSSSRKSRSITFLTSTDRRAAPGTAPGPAKQSIP